MLQARLRQVWPPVRSVVTAPRSSFWDAAARSIANSQHTTTATGNAPVADASALVAHSASLGIFEHSATTSFAATAHATDSHANIDARATTHIASSHVETEPLHSFGAPGWIPATLLCTCDAVHRKEVVARQPLPFLGT
jgi:hypothetical protein